jgi:hypothetical protein
MGSLRRGRAAYGVRDVPAAASDVTATTACGGGDMRVSASNFVCVSRWRGENALRVGNLSGEELMVECGGGPEGAEHIQVARCRSTAEVSGTTPMVEGVKPPLREESVSDMHTRGGRGRVTAVV